MPWDQYGHQLAEAPVDTRGFDSPNIDVGFCEEGGVKVGKVSRRPSSQGEVEAGSERENSGYERCLDSVNGK